MEMQSVYGPTWYFFCIIIVSRKVELSIYMFIFFCTVYQFLVSIIDIVSFYFLNSFRFSVWLVIFLYCMIQMVWQFWSSGKKLCTNFSCCISWLKYVLGPEKDCDIYLIYLMRKLRQTLISYINFKTSTDKFQ